MVSFVSKFKSLAQQAQQKVSEATESEQFKAAIKQAQEKVSEISTTAQGKVISAKQPTN
jgi:frataxin-like iron-binding protein CyaY